MVGKKYYNNNKMLIDEINTNKDFITIYSFLDNLVDEMSKSSIIISRSGATTISEIIALRKPSILIPSPNVTNNHQYTNAMDLVHKNAAHMIEEKNLNGNILVNEIDEILNNKEEYKKIKENLGQMTVTDSANRIYNVIKEMI